jgi:spore germination protein
MKIIKVVFLTVTFFTISIIQTGCWDQKIYEKIGFILQLGLELDEDGSVLYTAHIPLVSPDAEKRTELLTANVNLVREGLNKIRQISGKNVEGGKLQQIFFSEDIAEKGINELMEVFVRNPENPLLVNVVVVEGSPNELMNYSDAYKDKPRPTFYVNGLLENARRHNFVPETRISHFTIMAHSGTIDPTTPMLSYDRDEIKISGSALFSGDKMVGKIDTQDTGLLQGLKGNKGDIHYLYQGEHAKKEEYIKNGAAVLMNIKKRDIKIHFKDDKPIINIELKFGASIGEYPGELDLANPEEKKKLEKAVAEDIERDCLKLLKHLVDVESDPIGFGEIVRSKHNVQWKKINWKDVYKEASFNVEVKILFEFYGAVSNQ